MSNSQKPKMYRHSKQLWLRFQSKKMYVFPFFWHYWMCYYNYNMKNYFLWFHLAFSPFSCDFKDIFIIILLRCNHIQSWLKRNISPQWRHMFRWTKQTSSAKTYIQKSSVTSDAGSQYRCGRVGRGIQPPSTPKPIPYTQSYTKSI